MKADALHMLARQLRTDPNAEAIEDAAAALEACAMHRPSLECLIAKILGVPLAPCPNESPDQATHRIANEFASIQGHSRFLAESTGLAGTQRGAEDSSSSHSGYSEHLRSVS